MPSSGLQTTGYPIRSATATAWSTVRTDSWRGTGSPAAASSRVVRSLSEATSTAIALVADVIVARIRFWWTPWPSCTRECWLSRIHGMSRDIASSRIACVDGPNAVRSARRMNSLERLLEVELGVRLDEVVDQAYGEPRRGQPDLLVDVPVDDVVAPALALHLAGLAAPEVVADGLLERQRHVLGHVAEPGALVEPLDEAAAAAAGAGVLAQARAVPAGGCR